MKGLDLVLGPSTLPPLDVLTTRRNMFQVWLEVPQPAGGSTHTNRLKWCKYRKRNWRRKCAAQVGISELLTPPLTHRDTLSHKRGHRHTIKYLLGDFFVGSENRGPNKFRQVSFQERIKLLRKHAPSVFAHVFLRWQSLSWVQLYHVFYHVL